MPGVTLIDEHGKLHKNMHPSAGATYARMTLVPPDKLAELEALEPEERHPTELRARTAAEIETHRQAVLDGAKAAAIEGIEKKTAKFLLKRLAAIDVPDDQITAAIADAVRAEMRRARPLKQQVAYSTTVEEVKQVADDRT